MRMTRFNLITAALTFFTLLFLNGCQGPVTTKQNLPIPTEIVRQTYNPGLFSGVSINGPFKVSIIDSSASSSVEVIGQYQDITKVRLALQHPNLLSIYTALGTHFHQEVSLIIHTPGISMFAFRGSGFLKAFGLNRQLNELQLFPRGNQFVKVEGNFQNLDKLTLGGRGKVLLSGVKSVRPLQINTMQNTRAFLRGELNAYHLDASQHSEQHILWISSPYLVVHLSDNAHLRLAGRVKEFHVEITKNAFLDCRYLYTDIAYVKTFDAARADIQVAKKQFTFAAAGSNIYYFKPADFSANLMHYRGSVLAIPNSRQWSAEMPLGIE